MQGLLDWQMTALTLINRKFAALRRLAELIEQMGDVDFWIGMALSSLSNLIPVLDIDISLYTNLQVSCPFLGLPPFSNQDIANLKGRLNAAYGGLAARISIHPWARLDKVQGMLNDFQNKINYPYGSDYLRCLNAICAATVGASGSLLVNLSVPNISKELALFGKNFVQDAGHVLTEPMRQKRNEVIGAYNSVLSLRDESVRDFKVVTATGKALVVPPLRPKVITSPAYTFTAAQAMQVNTTQVF